MSEFLIYTLSDPRTGEVRYVGQTRRAINVRMNEHRHRANVHRTHLYSWFRSLQKDGLEPHIEVLEKCANFDHANECEIYWIEIVKSWGFRLVNHDKGGAGRRGYCPSPETIEKVRLANLGKKKPGTSAAMRMRAKGVIFSEQRRTNISRALGGRSFEDQNGCKYQTISEACRKLNLKRHLVRAVLNGQRQSCQGFVFKYLEETTI